RSVGFTDQSEERPRRPADVEIVREGRGDLGFDRPYLRIEARVTPRRTRCFVEARAERVDPRELAAGPREGVEREVEGRTIVGRQQEITERARVVPLRDEIPNRMEVPLRLRHLLAVDHQVGGVHPVPYERAAGRALALRDLVLVVRKDVVDSARM